jgi:hypothetical protein
LGDNDMSQIAEFNLYVGESQCIDATFQLPPENRSVVRGVVIDCCGNPIENAVVTIMEEVGGCDCGCDGAASAQTGCGEAAVRPAPVSDLQMVAQAFTDHCGQFFIGPLCPEQEYKIMVWVNNVCQCEQELEFRVDCSQTCSNQVGYGNTCGCR